MSYQLPEENSDFGTPRGGLRTVPMRSPSSFALGPPSLTIRIAIALRSWPADPAVRMLAFGA
jgi:hypothetical protein